MPLDRERLTKLMGLTTSTNDHEALSALRKANEIIKGEKLTWNDLLAEAPMRQVTVTVNRYPTHQPYQSDGDWVSPHLKDKVMIDLMFRGVFAQPRSSNEEFWQFMDSIHQRWVTHGNLTQNQYNALKRSYQRVAKTA